MELFNSLIHFLLAIGLSIVFITAIVMWWKNKSVPFYAKSSYWAYVTVGLFFVSVSKYADVYAPVVPLERALYVYISTTLLFLGMVFIVVAVKRLLTTLFDIQT